VAELGGQSAESRRLTYAWRLRHLLLFNGARHKLVADILQVLIILFAFASTSAAVMYSYYNTNNCDDSWREYVEFIETLAFILPLVNTLFNGMFASLNPAGKSAILRLAATKVESEIYMYRTKVGAYSMRGSSGSKSEKNSKKDKGKDDQKKPKVQVNPRKIFSGSLEVIWTDLAASDISKGALVNPPLSDNPLADINDKIKANKDAQSLLIDALQQPGSEEKKADTQFPRKSFSSCFASLCRSQPKPTDHGITLRDLNVQVENLQDLDEQEEAFGAVSHMKKFSNPKHGTRGPDIHNVYNSEETFEASNPGNFLTEKRLSLTELVLGGHAEEPHTAAAAKKEGSVASKTPSHAYRGVSSPSPEVVEPHPSKAKESDEEIYDDGLSSITADEYVKMRLIPILAEYTNTAPKLSSSIYVLTMIVISFSVTSSLFS
jgi:hypothetical protein